MVMPLLDKRLVSYHTRRRLSLSSLTDEDEDGRKAKIFIPETGRGFPPH
jgi:hypothetical protein